MSEASVALVRRDETTALATGAASAWTRERMDLIKRTICPKGISDDEFALFVEQCKRSGLDPMAKEAFCVPRRVNIGTKERPNWISKHEMQPSEAGMLARAEHFPDFRGITAAAVYEKDTIEIDAGAGTVSHKFRPGPVASRGALLGAWARLVRADKETVVVWLDLEGYRQPTPLWGKIPGTMIEKCARVAALRKGYPSAFGGLYTADEMPPPDGEEVAPAPAVVETPRTVTPSPSPALASARDARSMRIWRKAQAAGATKDTFAPWVASVLGHETPSSKWTEGDMDALEDALNGCTFAAREEVAAALLDSQMVEEPLDAEFTPEPPAAPEPTVRQKGQDVPISQLSAKSMEFWADKLRKDVEDPAKARWAEQNRATLHAIQLRLGEVSA